MSIVCFSISLATCFHLLVLLNFNNQVNLKYMGESMVKTSFYGNLHVEELTVII